jgi:hypothetical protein
LADAIAKERSELTRRNKQGYNWPGVVFLQKCQVWQSLLSTVQTVPILYSHKRANVLTLKQHDRFGNEKGI